MSMYFSVQNSRNSSNSVLVSVKYFFSHHRIISHHWNSTQQSSKSSKAIYKISSWHIHVCTFTLNVHVRVELSTRYKENTHIAPYSSNKTQNKIHVTIIFFFFLFQELKNSFVNSHHRSFSLSVVFIFFFGVDLIVTLVFIY